MYCGNCGKKLKDNAKYCGKCGFEQHQFSKEQKIIYTEKGLKDGQSVCPSCGVSRLIYSEKYGKLHCEYCNSLFDGKKIEELEDDVFKLKENIIGSGVRNIKANAKDIITLKCGGCGAEVVIDTKETTHAKCHWCRSILSINSRIENGAVPDVVLPFSVTKEEAKREIEKYVSKRRFFALSKFNKEFTTENIMGVYFPYLLVDVNASCDFIGTGRIRTSNDFANLYNVRRKFDVAVNNLSIETSDKLDKDSQDKTNNIINSIMPFDVENCIKFESNYLVGYTSEKRNISINNLYPKIDKQLNDVIRHSLNDDLKNYDRGINWENEIVNIKGTQIVTAYLPVWLYSYYENKNGKQKLHYVAVNGRTKELIGSVPISMKKVAITLILIILAYIFLLLGAMNLFNMSLYIEDEQNAFLFFIMVLAFLPFIFLNSIFKKYRNPFARHRYEKETDTVIKNIQREDEFIKNVRELPTDIFPYANNDRLDAESRRINNIKKMSEQAAFYKKAVVIIIIFGLYFFFTSISKKEDKVVVDKCSYEVSSSDYIENNERMISDYDFFSGADKYYYVRLKLDCKTQKVSLADEKVKIDFNYNENENYYDTKIYINNNLVETNFSVHSELNVYKYNNLYFMRENVAYQCGTGNTLIVNSDGEVLKIMNYIYIFNPDSTISVHNYGNCFDVNDDKVELYKVENDSITIIEN